MKFLLICILCFSVPALVAQPVITEFSPLAASTGSTVKIKGVGFSLSLANNIVYFGPVRAIVTTALETELQVIVPSGATHQKLSVTVGNLIGYSRSFFTPVSGLPLTAQSFSIKNSFPTFGNYTTSLVAADFNVDHKPDFVVSNFESDNLSLFTNSSAGGVTSFGPAVLLPMGKNPEGMATGDLNGDGKLDLAAVSISERVISVFINTSIGSAISFAPRFDIAAGVNCAPRRITIADLNGDGRAELVVTDNNKFIDWNNNSSYGTLSIYKNTTGSALSFEAPVVFQTKDYCRDVKVGDLDGDSKPDIAITNFVTHGWSVFKNTSENGVISLGPRMDMASGNHSEQCSMGDLDGDGKLDLVISHLTSNNVSLFRNTSTNGVISFALQQNLSGSSPIGITIGDVDGDSKPDLAVAQANGGNVSVFKNTSVPGVISLGPPMNYSSGPGPLDVIINDVDNDGLPELALTGSAGHELVILKAPPGSVPTVSLGQDTTLCEGTSLLLNASVPGSNTYQWSTGAQSQTITVSQPGVYWVTITRQGHVISDTIAVRYTSVPGLNLGVDTSLCSGSALVLRPEISGATYQWQNNSTADSFVITVAGSYWLQLSKDGCKVADTLTVTYMPLPSLNLGRDTSLCPLTRMTLLASDTSIQSYLWQDQTTASSFLVTGPGKYWVTAMGNNGCYQVDTINVVAYAPQPFSLGPDLHFCGQPIILNPHIRGGRYTWQNGSRDSIFKVQQPGTYSVSITDACQVRVDTIKITDGICNLFMPTAFTPNGDGKNDVFKVEYPQFIKTFKMQVFNRWGELVYQTSNPTLGWDGKHKQQPSPTGNFVWLINLTDLENNPMTYKGNVVLIR